MLNKSEYEKLLQNISLKFLPADALLSGIEIKYKDKIKKFKENKLVDAYTYIKDLQYKGEKFFVYFKFKDDDIHQQSENFAFDLLYS